MDPAESRRPTQRAPGSPSCDAALSPIPVSRPRPQPSKFWAPCEDSDSDEDHGESSRGLHERSSNKLPRKMEEYLRVAKEDRSIRVRRQRSSIKEFKSREDRSHYQWAGPRDLLELQEDPALAHLVRRWNFRPGLLFEQLIHRCYGCSVHHPSSSIAGAFHLTAVFRRFTFRLTESSVSMALNSCLGGSPSGFHVKFVKDRHFRFSVASRDVGFEVLKLKRITTGFFDIYFHLWNGDKSSLQLHKERTTGDDEEGWQIVLSKSTKRRIRSLDANPYIFARNSSNTTGGYRRDWNRRHATGKGVKFRKPLNQSSPKKKSVPEELRNVIKIGEIYCPISFNAQRVFKRRTQNPNSSIVPAVEVFKRLKNDFPSAFTAKPHRTAPDKGTAAMQTNRGLLCKRCLGPNHAGGRCTQQIRCYYCFGYGHVRKICLRWKRDLRVSWAPKVKPNISVATLEPCTQDATAVNIHSLNIQSLSHTAEHEGQTRASIGVVQEANGSSATPSSDQQPYTIASQSLDRTVNSPFQFSGVCSVQDLQSLLATLPSSAISQLAIKGTLDRATGCLTVQIVTSNSSAEMTQAASAAFLTNQSPLPQLACSKYQHNNIKHVYVRRCYKRQERSQMAMDQRGAIFDASSFGNVSGKELTLGKHGSPLTEESLRRSKRRATINNGHKPINPHLPPRPPRKPSKLKKKAIEGDDLIPVSVDEFPDLAAIDKAMQAGIKLKPISAKALHVVGTICGIPADQTAPERLMKVDTQAVGATEEAEAVA